MAATGARIEPYSYSDGTAQWQSTHTLAVNLAGVASVRHPTPMRLEDALASWQGLLDAAKPAGAPWALSYSSTTRRVTIASAGPIFSAVFPANVGPWLGFTAGTLTGAATYTGDSAPAGLVQCMGLGYAQGEQIERLEVAELRHGRATAYAWGNMLRFQVTLAVNRSLYPWQIARSLTPGDPTGGWAVCGRLRIHQSGGSASEYSETVPTGYVDGTVTACEIDPRGSVEGLLRVTLTMVRPVAATGIAEPTGLWGSLRYGWSPIYWLTIAGIPYAWTERATTLNSPSAFPSQAVALQIDDSAAVGSTIDRSRGLGVGLPLSFSLRDGSATAAMLARPSASTYLSANLNATATVVPVEATASFPGTGAIYCGLETITYTATGGTTFNPATRGAYGSLAVAHRVGVIGQHVANTPRVWGGRDVRLYALACDPTGTPTGTDLGDDSVEVWRGRIEGNAVRRVGAWQFTASALDRILDRKLAGKISGKVVGWGTAVQVNPNWRVKCVVEGLTSAQANNWGPFTIQAYPFLSYTAGQMISRSEAIGAIVTAWSAAVTALGAPATTYISTVLQVDDLQSATGGIFTLFRPILKTSATTFYVRMITSEWGSFMAKAEIANSAALLNIFPVYIQANDAPLTTQWSTGHNPLIHWTPGSPLPDMPNAPNVQIDEGAFDLLDSTGYLQFSGKTAKHLVKYGGFVETDGIVIFQLDLDSDASFSIAEIDGASVAVWSSIGPLSLESLMLTCIQSSGAGTQGSFDTASQGSGYAVDATDVYSFSNKNGSTGLKATVSTAGSSFADLFSGALALSQQAVVQRDVSGACVLALVDSAPWGSDYATTITDHHLLHLDGDPITAIDKMTTPNAIECEAITGAEQEGDAAKVTAIDAVQIAAVGQVSESWRIPAESRQQLIDVVAVRSASIFGAQPDSQAVKVRTVPWTEAEIGDLVRFTCTYPGLWDYATTRAGYDGMARVTGRTIVLKSCEVELTLLLEGQSVGHSLCPAMQVVAFDSAGAATWIDVDQKYLPHMTAALAAAGGAVTLLHYKPGTTEGTAQRYAVTTATLTGGYCRLAGLTQTGVFNLVLADRSTLTLPADGAAYSSAYQDNFSHVDDGSRWL